MKCQPANPKLAATFTKLADNMQKAIDHGRRSMTQNPTPKRMREYASRVHDADNAERTQRALRALAAGHAAGTLSPALAALKNKAEIAPLVHKSLVSHGYYHVSTDPEYRDKSELGRALQSLIGTTRSEAQLAEDVARAKAAEVRGMEDRLRFADISGFFPTPAAVVRKMIAEAEIEPGMTVLEPSAGKGDIADAVAEIVGKRNMTLCEISPALFNILVAKGYGDQTVHGDFLLRFGNRGKEIDEVYDRILMNPAFEKGQDVAHIRHAYKMLKPSGRLVALASTGWQHGQSKKAVAFREWLKEIGANTDALAADAFNGKDAFRRTGVRATMIVADKPKVQAAAAGKSKAPTSVRLPARVAKPEPKPLPESTLGQIRGSLLAKYRPNGLADIVGQPAIVKSLQSFVQQPGPVAFIFHGPSGVGKTSVAHALANDLGCDGEWGGVVEIPSGTQDGKAVDALLKSLHLRPLCGSGWKVAIINEADRMTDQAEAMWLDGLEHLPSKCVVIFTTNNLLRLTDRFIRRCEVYAFDGTSATFKSEMERMVERVWERETGAKLTHIPEGLGRFELSADGYSIALALQQITPYLRTGKLLPRAFHAPIVRDDKPRGDSQGGDSHCGGRKTIPAPRRQFCSHCARWIRKGEPALRSPAGGKAEWTHPRCVA